MHLNCHSHYSLKYGLLSITELVDQAANLGIRQLALTDINNTSGHLEFVNQCRSYDIMPSLGIEFRANRMFYYIGLALTRKGLSNLNQLLNSHLVGGLTLPKRAPLLAETLFIYNYEGRWPTDLRENEFVGIRPEQLNHFYRHEHQLVRGKVVALNSITLSKADDLRAHRILRAIDLNTTLTRLPASVVCGHAEYLQSAEQLQTIYRVYPHLLDAAGELLHRSACKWELKARNKRSYTSNLVTDSTLLARLTYAGMYRRYHANLSEVRKRISSELRLIGKLRFETYYLITWDITRFARKQGFHHVGRGSGANSVVAYCLGITDVDPIRLNLYFERFINPHRPVPPDFDLDFSWDQRDTVISYVSRKYGKEHVGILASFQTFKGKSTVRELGKVFGLPKEEIDLIIKKPQSHSEHHHLAEEIFREGRRILGLPSHLSIHAGALVISEQPLSTIAASQMMPKGFSVLQLDKHQSERWGLHKYDLLGQRGIGHIKEAVEIIKNGHKVLIDINHMDTVVSDPSALALLRSPGSCIGCFYIESPAMRGLLAKVKCKTYEDLIAVTSIIRPGVAKSGMMKAFIERYHDPKKITSIHPVLSRLLKNTFGIMVYQEDVMKVVHHLGRFSLYEADLLRRIMTGKRKSASDLANLKGRFISNCQSAGMSPSVVSEIWRQISSFSGYAFCKAHSATYAAESMQSAYLKAHFPVEFMVAVINNQGGFYPTSVYVRELQKTGAKVELPCINRSSWFTRLSKGVVFLGLNLIKGLSKRTGHAILSLRQQMNIVDLDMLMAVVAPKQLQLLIDIGACRTLDPSQELLTFRALSSPTRHSHVQLKLFQQSEYQHQIDPPLSPAMRKHLREQELLGFTMATPFCLLHKKPSSIVLQRDMTKHDRKTVRMFGFYVIEKPVTTESGSHMCFITWIDEEHQYFDSVHFARSLELYPMQGKGFYLLEGRIEVDLGYPSMIVTRMKCWLSLEHLSEVCMDDRTTPLLY